MGASLLGQGVSASRYELNSSRLRFKSALPGLGQAGRAQPREGQRARVSAQGDVRARAFGLRGWFLTGKRWVVWARGCLAGFEAAI